ncbi:MAG: 3-hydroxyacyl-[acyl-carrier-protein] dehydratase FabZ [Lautropia sp.]|nr:MAG: 3-hydroxyacyl-[acyl-carrier-protein] dehydratase FabZ [Pseudomonadota bacterium]MBC6958469.1 3-hydroxyacyl-[acyl-carrier-protein] dehydratase FabZ [Lautropia sp.]MCL4700391.1 3-hydroxyacyl-ACP dehydratase FabZ [Burkholderiaceae bacterium]MCZ2415710.1 3-hydroxyacyl-ACP dehydratase FabZ [Burkholderiales bacterium]MDL1906935.1 3-hydroxyacyl-ACP dehydratase FabZ [Betaproteobacteria bacterium PRO1]
MTVLDIRAILEHLPHRYPMLLVDRVLELDKGKRIVAVKNVSINEPFFTGHFPYLPVMPGVLQVEALAQAAGILSFQTMGRVSDASTVYYFVGIDSARFKRPVVPGDQLRLEVEILRISRSIWKYAGKATVDGQVAAEAELMCTLREIGPANGNGNGNGPGAA